MKISLTWLKDYINLDGVTVEQISNALTDVGLEVEAVQRSAAFGDTVVVGRIVQAVKHPNADSLKVCTVDVGKPDLLQIVCGAPNARVGLDACVALVGSTLPGDFKIKEAKIRGEESFGMMCSSKELGLGEGQAGIIELASGFKPGTPVIKVLGLDDVVLTLNVTPNRADCLGHIGVARDLGARLGRTLQLPLSVSAKSASMTSKDIQVQIKTDRCLRFTAMAIQNVRCVPSPSWIKQRIEAVGMRSVNLIVDLTNYVMFEMNHPIHAYDERDVHGREFVIREARDQEALTTLDGQERLLKAGDVLICDRDRPIGLAGVMGGLNSEIKDDTTGLILEVACFDPQSVRATARRLGIHSEASHRFERGIDSNNSVQVARRFADLLQAAMSDVVISLDVVDQFPVKPQPKLIALRISEAKSFLALPALTAEQIKKIFEGLHFRLVDQATDRMVFEIPTWRVDIERECDLIEEIARMIGYDKVPYQLPRMELEPTPEDALVDFIESTRISFATKGLRETVSFPFWSDDDQRKMLIPSAHPLAPTLKLANPIADDAKWMHTTLACSLIKAIANNRRHGVKGARLFELGRGYFDFNSHPLTRQLPNSLHSQLFKGLDRKGRHLSPRARDEKNRPTERHWVCGVIDQPWRPKTWASAEVPAQFFDIKSLVLSWLKSVSIADVQVIPPEKGVFPFLHPGSSAYLMARGQVLGWLGEIHPEVSLAYGLEPAEPLMLFELDLEAVLEVSQKRTKIHSESYKFPPSTRDLALLVASDISHDVMAAAIAKFPQKRHLKIWNLFDVFQGQSIPDGKKSVAWSFSFQSPEKTLTDVDVDSEFKNLTQYLTTTFQAEQR